VTERLRTRSKPQLPHLNATAFKNHFFRVRSATLEQPAAFIAGSLDPVLGFLPGVDLVARMREHVSDLRLVRIIDGAGHWVQQERPAEVNAALLEFLGGLA
jgi:pimeloyl-ACP methyl ester carboxylesterase